MMENTPNWKQTIHYQMHEKAQFHQVELKKDAAAIKTLEIQTMSIESSLNHMEVIQTTQNGCDTTNKI